MRCELIAEMATNWAGDLGLACEMIAVAADAGADICKFQSYQTQYLSPSDPQYDWLKHCELSDGMHAALMAECERRGVKFLTTVFNEQGLERCKKLGVNAFKIGHAESSQSWWWLEAYNRSWIPFYVSWPWGRKQHRYALNIGLTLTHLSVATLYPTPPEALAALTLLDGYSDHSEGLDAAKWAIARGATVIEKHFSIPGKGRNQPWDMTVPMLRELRDWADRMAVIQTGTRHSERWTHTKTG